MQRGAGGQAHSDHPEDSGGLDGQLGAHTDTGHPAPGLPPWSLEDRESSLRPARPSLVTCSHQLSLFPRGIEPTLDCDPGRPCGGGVARQAAQRLREGSWSPALLWAGLGCESSQTGVPCGLQGGESGDE